VPLAVRPATLADAAAIAAIHNQGIEEREATFETEPRTPEDVARSLARDGAPPCLVAVRAGEVVGWARIWSYSDRACYAGVGEASIYIDRAARGAGVGRRLVEALVEEAERLGYWKLVGLLFPANAGSLALFRAAGFEEVGTFRNHARLDGAWRDVLVVERRLGDATQSADPAA
jgi:L-amino acid N-acyltransferase YncA